jgi:hypothetical protein
MVPDMGGARAALHLNMDAFYSTWLTATPPHTKVVAQTVSLREIVRQAVERGGG